MADNFELFYVYDLTSPGAHHCRTLDATYFDWLFSKLEGTGVTFLYRINIAGRCYYHSKLMAAFDHASVDPQCPQGEMWHRLADMLDGCDPLAEAVRAARRYNVPIWGWWNWNEWQNVRIGYIDLVDRVWYDKPRKYWCSRDGSRFYCGVPDWGDSEVVDRLLGLTRETLDYGLDGLFLSTRSHSWWACWPTSDWDKHLEPFGFNDSVVSAYRKRYGGDIRYDDYDEEKWLGIKGEQFSALLARVGAMAHQVNRKFIMGIEPDRYSLMVDYARKDVMHPAAPHLRLYKDWETWVAEGSVDGICAEEACHPSKKMTGGDIDPLRQTLTADFPLYTWADTSWYHERGAGPFSMGNWDRLSVEELLEQIDMAEQTGAAGIFLHSIEQFTAWDSQGKSIGGYGVLPRTEYFDALRQRAKERGAVVSSAQR
jgi:hypothetical protein